MNIKNLLLVVTCVLVTAQMEQALVAKDAGRFTSPTATFETAKQAMVRGDYDTFCLCFNEEGLSLIAGSLRMMTGMMEWAGKQENADRQSIKMAKGIGRINGRFIKSQPDAEIELDLDALPEAFMASVRKRAEPIDDRPGYVAAVLKLMHAHDKRPRKNRPVVDAVLQNLKIEGESATAVMNGTFLIPRMREDPIVFRRDGLVWKIEQLGRYGITEAETSSSPMRQTPPPKNKHPAKTKVRDTRGYTPLMRAAKLGQTGIVKRLLDGGAEIDAKPDAGEWTALCLAIHGKHRETAQLLVDRKAQFPNHESFARNMRRSATRLGVQLPDSLLPANERSVQGRRPQPKKKVLPVLPEVSQLKPIDQPDEKGFSQLHRARSVEVAQALIDQGADINVRQRKFHGTPLQYAASFGRLDMVRLLLKHKATVDATDTNGRTPLHWAASQGHPEVVRVLISAGAGINKTNRGRWTALHYAADKDHFEVAQVLIENGASLTLKNSQGKTPLDLNPNIAPPN